MDRARVEAALHDLYIAVEGARLRDEDRRKAAQLTAVMQELSRLGKRGVLVDAAAGKGYVGLLALEVLGWERVVLLEREPSRAAASRALADARWPGRCSVMTGDVADASLWPERPDVVVALHACGAVSDHILDAAVRSNARWILVAPCCYGDSIPHASDAARAAERAGIPGHAEVRRRFLQAWIDAERVLRLESAGYETTVVPFVPPTVTPHNLLFRARRVGVSKRSQDAAARHEAMCR